MAVIHSTLLNDCLLLGRFKLCQLLLSKDANYPWYILVPDRENIREIYQLSSADQSQLMTESSVLGEFLMQTYNGDKLNIAALGNMVSQLHIHHVVRFKSDASWPNPIWGNVDAKVYTEDALNKLHSTFSNRKLKGFNSNEQ